MKEFESIVFDSKDGDTRLQEQKLAIHQTFVKAVKALVSTLDEMGNSFKEETTDLYALDTKYVIPASVLESVKNPKQLGQSQYYAYVVERFDQALGQSPSKRTICHCLQLLTNLRGSQQPKLLPRKATAIFSLDYILLVKLELKSER